MMTSLFKRLSKRLSGRGGDDNDEEADRRPSLSRRKTKELDNVDGGGTTRGDNPSLQRKSTSGKTSLSKRDTVQLERESSLTKKSSVAITIGNERSRKSATSMMKAPSLQKKLTSKKTSSAGGNASISVRTALSLARKSSAVVIGDKTVSGATKKTKKSSGKTLWYLGGIYVTVMNDEGTWFLCRLKHNVYNTTKSVKVRWLSRKLKGTGKNDYKLDYADEVDPACILFNVRVTREGSTFTLLEEDRLETEKLLKIVSDVASGKMTNDDVDSDVEEVVQIEPPPPKKRKTEGKSKTKTTEGKSKTKKGEKKPKREKTTKKKDAGSEPKRKVAKKKDTLVLHPNPNIKVLHKDPFFETTEHVPYISKYAHQRLVFRAVHMRDHKLLKKLTKDVQKIKYLSSHRSAADGTTALHHAIKLQDEEAMSLLIKDYMGDDQSMQEKRDKSLDDIKVSMLETGNYNPRSLGVTHIRKIMASRGSREGNNALIKDISDMQGSGNYNFCDIRWFLPEMFRQGLDFDIMRKMILQTSKKKSIDVDFHYTIMRSIDTALLMGHYKLAGEFLQEVADKGRSFGKISYLHYEVLLSEANLKNVPPSQVKVQIRNAKQITPIHCAACNPNTKHLERLLKVDPDFHVADRSNRRPIHYASGCESTAPLEFLVKNGANMYDPDSTGNIPLHYAVMANRAKNVEFLLDSGRKGTVDPFLAKYGSSCINRPNKMSQTPLHLAAKEGHLDVVKVLVEKGAVVDCVTSVSTFKVTPLMFAAQMGFLDIVEFLVDNGAVVQREDRLGRTAVVHAAMNGNANVLSYLLNIGADPELGDSSGNTPLHYAAAYGWYFCVKVLIQAKVNMNVGNDWKTTPLSIAYMKAHMGIVHLLLEETDVDVNFQDDKGLSLVSLAAASTLSQNLLEEMTYLIEERGALCTFTDNEDQTALNHLSANSILLDVIGTSGTKVPSKEAAEISVKIAKLLVANGCDINVIDKQVANATSWAMLMGNLPLTKYLVGIGCPVITDQDDDGDNVLNSLCYYLGRGEDGLSILKYVAKMNGKSGTPNLKKPFCDMVKAYSNDGVSPLLRACESYRKCSPPQLVSKVKTKQRKGDESDEDYHERLILALWDDLRNNMSPGEKEVTEKWWRDGREFIRMLIEEFGADVNDTVKEKTYKDGQRKPKAEKDRYQSDFGKSRPVDILARVTHEEYPEEGESDFAALEMLLNYKPKVDLRGLDGHMVLTRCLQNRQDKIAQLLIEKADVDVNDFALLNLSTGFKKSEEVYKLSTLALAVSNKCYKSVELLLDGGADPDFQDEENGKTPLHFAIDNHRENETDACLNVVSSLIDHDASVNIQDNNKQTPLHRAVDVNSGTMDTNLDVILALAESGANMAIQDKWGRTPLHYVFIKENKHPLDGQHDPVELCRVIGARMKPSDINIQDNYGMTALHRAAYRGANICCLYLLQKGAKVNTRDKDGNTPLAMAVLGNHDGCATVLIQNGAGLKEMVSPSKCITAGPQSSKEKEDEVVHVWTWKFNKSVDSADTKKPLYQIAIEKELQGVCFLLMDKPVKETGIAFDDAIEMAMKLEKYNIVRRLLMTCTDNKALLRRGENGGTLLHCLTLNSTTFYSLVQKIVEQLVKKGLSLTDQDDNKCTPLYYAALNNNFGLAKFIMDQPKAFSPKITDGFGRSVLAASFWEKSADDNAFVDWIDKLYEKKCSLDELIDVPIAECCFGMGTFPWTCSRQSGHYWTSTSDKRVSPLVIAICQQNRTLTQHLLKKGAGVNVAILGSNDLVLVKTLMNYDFDPDAKEEEPKKDTAAAKKGLFQLRRKQSSFSKKSVDSSSDSEESDMETDEADQEQKTPKKDFKPFKKVSAVNLNAVDKKGWTVMHHAASCLSYGTFDNEEMVFILAKAGAKLDTRNKDGDTPLDLALKTGSVEVAHMIQKLDNVKAKERKEPKFSKSTVHDGLKWVKPVPSFQDDAEKMMDKLGRPMEVDESKFEAKVDPNCDVTDGTLVKDEDQDVLYDALCTKVDVMKGSWGMYNFYQMQIVYQPGKSLYILFTRWGRIGDQGQYQHTPFPEKAGAVKEFSKIFRSKTGNKWTDVKSFVKHPGKYHLVDDIQRQTKEWKSTPTKFNLESKMKSHLPDHLQKLFKDLADVSAINSSAKSEWSDLSGIPVGRKQRDRLIKARKILAEISALVGQVEEHRTELRKLSYREVKQIKMMAAKEGGEKKNKKYQENCEKISKLSSEFHQLIPKQDFVYEKLSPLDNDHMVAREISFIQNLLDYEVAGRMLLGAMYRIKEVNPLDYIYQSVGCKMELLSEEDDEAQYILRYITSPSNDFGGSTASVTGIYRLEISGEQDRLAKKKIDNHRLLFHGTSVCNLLSILNRGLVIAPPEARVSGHLYGKGIYFSDTFDKSFRYTGGHSTRCVLLCEVALGKQKVLINDRSEHYDEKYDSLFAVGRNRPEGKYDVRLPTGCMMDLSEKSNNYRYQDQYIYTSCSEYIVFDEDQVCLRYLIQCKE